MRKDTIILCSIVNPIESNFGSSPTSFIITILLGMPLVNLNMFAILHIHITLQLTLAITSWNFPSFFLETAVKGGRKFHWRKQNVCPSLWHQKRFKDKWAILDIHFSPLYCQHARNLVFISTQLQQWQRWQIRYRASLALKKKNESLHSERLHNVCATKWSSVLCRLQSNLLWKTCFNRSKLNPFEMVIFLILRVVFLELEL